MSYNRTSDYRHRYLRLSDTNRSFRKFILFCLCLILLLLSYQHIVTYLDQRKCLCSQLTYEHSMYEINEKLASCVDLSTLNDDTFLYTTVSCKHGKRIVLTIFASSGVFYGHLLK